MKLCCNIPVIPQSKMSLMQKNCQEVVDVWFSSSYVWRILTCEIHRGARSSLSGSALFRHAFRLEYINYRFSYCPESPVGQMLSTSYHWHRAHERGRVSV